MRITTYDDKGNKVGEIKNWSQVKIGGKNVTIYQGWQQLYPDPNSLPIGQAEIGNSFIIGGDRQ